MSEGAGGDGPGSPQLGATRKALIPKDSAEEAAQQVTQPSEDLNVFRYEEEAAERIRLEQNVKNLQEGATKITTPVIEALDYKAAKLSKDGKDRWDYEGRRCKLTFDRPSEDTFKLDSLDMQNGDRDSGERLRLKFEHGKLLSAEFDWHTVNTGIDEEMNTDNTTINDVESFISTYANGERYSKADLAALKLRAFKAKANVLIDLGPKPSIKLTRQGWNRELDLTQRHDRNTLVYNEDTNMFENSGYPGNPKMSVDEFKAILASTLAQIPMDEVEVPTSIT